MKDGVVRTQSSVAASKVATLQQMTCYTSSKMAANNPVCHTILLNMDEIVHQPHKAGEGERLRDRPMWTMLLPPGHDVKLWGKELENLGRAMQGKRKKTSETNGEQFNFDMNIVNTSEEYHASLYGAPKKRRAKEVWT